VPIGLDWFKVSSVRNPDIGALKLAAIGSNGSFSFCGADDGFGQLNCCICNHQRRSTYDMGSEQSLAAERQNKIGWMKV